MTLRELVTRLSRPRARVVGVRCVENKCGEMADPGLRVWVWAEDARGYLQLHVCPRHAIAARDAMRELFEPWANTVDVPRIIRPRPSLTYISGAVRGITERGR